MTGSVLNVRLKKNISLKLIKLYTDGRSFLFNRSVALQEKRALKTIPRFVFFNLIFCSLLFLHAPAWALCNNISQSSYQSSDSQDMLAAKELVAQSDKLLVDFLEDPNIKLFQKYIKKACGVFIVPQLFRGDFLIGSSGGSGVLLAQDPIAGKWSYPGFYTIDSVSTGLQIGADASEIILLIMTEQGMQAMLLSQFTINSSIVVAAGTLSNVPNMKSKPSQQSPSPLSARSADILAFARSMMGIISGVSLTGSIITPQRALNNAFYGRPVSLEDILVRQVVNNHDAESLRKRVMTAGASSL
ncbi:MAG: hypothetical protein D3915_00140 [Candidatus Electrothrix sp. AU1_5]|nr:hypothetical protein [Candidatus Electrothrix sp. AX1]MCI5180962.1 hypothetical protein [Candidatus Electrothrix gigas]MCI5191529.1 hypothetical protein [Candidatus Electrothrix gigas]